SPDGTAAWAWGRGSPGAQAWQRRRPPPQGGGAGPVRCGLGRAGPAHGGA
ncbi:hypothetical protein HMPREF0731_1197, partial [Pseudoroseomonas cervicalis ATCC 49957]